MTKVGKAALALDDRRGRRRCGGQRWVGRSAEDASPSAGPTTASGTWRRSTGRRSRPRRSASRPINKSSATKLRLLTCNTQGNKPAIAKACARKLLGQGADVIMTTCDVDYAAPVVQESINAGKLTVAACIGTDQMGPKRFGAEGSARLLLRERRAGRGLGDGRVRVEAGLAQRVSRDRHGDRVLPQRRPGVQGTLDAARREDRDRGELPVRRR